MNNPQLIENSAKNYLFQTLQKCHTNRVSIYYYVFNFGILFMFIFIFGVTLYYCNKNKMTDYEKSQKMINDQDYIMSKIRYYREDKKEKIESQFSNITDLPYTLQ